MKNGKIKYALASTIKDGLLCKDGIDYIVTSDYQDNERYEGDVLLFDSIEDAREFILINGYYALEPVTFNN